MNYLQQSLSNELSQGMVLVTVTIVGNTVIALAIQGHYLDH